MLNTDMIDASLLASILEQQAEKIANALTIYAKAADHTDFNKTIEAFEELKSVVEKTEAEINLTLDMPDNDDRTALHWMVFHRNEESVAKLIANKANVNAQDRWGWTPLHMAAFRGNVNIMRLLLLNGGNPEQMTTGSYAGEDGGLTFPKDCTARSIAKIEEYPKIVALLKCFQDNLNNPAEVRIKALALITDISSDPIFVCHDLISAVQCGDLVKTEEFLKAGGDSDSKIKDVPLIVYAAKNRDQSMCQLLHRYKADINAVDAEGNTGIYWAAKSGVLSLFKFFLDNHANIEARNNERFVLHAAVMGKNVKIVEILLQANANPNCQDIEGNTPLHYVMDINDNVIVKGLISIFIKKAANLDVQNKMGSTVLHKVAFNNDNVCAKIFLEANADFKVLNKKMQTPLQVAEEGTKEEYIKAFLQHQSKVTQKSSNIDTDHFNPSNTLLEAARKNDMEGVISALEMGANINAVDKQKKTALHWIVWYGDNLSGIKELIKRGANVNACDEFGWPPMYMAIHHQQENIIDVFIEAKADIFLLAAKSYQEPGKPVCLPNIRGLVIARQTGDLKLFQKLQSYAYQQQMAGKENTINNRCIAAVLSYNLTLAQTFLSAGASPDSLVNNSPLAFYAVESGDVGLVKLLREYNVNLLAEDDAQNNMLDIAARRAPNVAMLKLVLSLNFDVNRPRPSSLTTAIMAACVFRSVEFVQCLHDSGAGVDLLNKDGDTALLICLKNRVISVDMREANVNYLIGLNVNLKVKNHDGNNAIFYAALYGSLAILRLLIERGVSFHEQNVSGRTALSFACETNEFEIVQELINRKANIEARSKQDWSVLGTAVSNNSFESVRCLVQAGVKCNGLFANGSWSALQLASHNGNDAIVTLLLGQPYIDVNVKNAIDGNDAGDRTALIAAAMNGHHEVVAMLISANATVDHYDRGGWTALKAAAAYGYLKTIREILKAKVVNPNFRINDVRFMASPLNKACENGMVDAVKLLIQTPGIDVNQNDFSGGTAFTKAVDNNHVDVVRVLLGVPKLSLAGIDADGKTGLVIAREKGYAEIEDLILDKMKQGAGAVEFPLHFAAQTGELDTLERVLNDDNIDINSQNAAGETALYVATYYKQASVVGRLLAYDGIEVDLPNGMKMTPLYTASTLGYKAIVQLLIQAGAEVNKFGPMWTTALSQAAELGRADIVEELLLSIDCDPNLSRPVRGNDGYGPLIQILTMGFRGLSASYYYYEGDYVKTLSLLVHDSRTNINIRNAHWCGYFSALIRAVDNCEFLRLILNHPKTNLNLMTKSGYSALSQAASQGSTQSIYMLLRKPGVNVNLANKDGDTPLICAAATNRIDCMEALLHAKDKDLQIDKANHANETALWIAASKGYLAIVNLLLKVDAGVYMKNADGETPIMAAAKQGHIMVVRSMVEYAIKNDVLDIILYVDEKGFTARLSAIRFGYMKLATYLKEMEDKILKEKIKTEQEALNKKLQENTQSQEMEQKQHSEKEKASRDPAEVKQHVERMGTLTFEHDRMFAAFKMTQYRAEADQYLSSEGLLKTFKYYTESKLTGFFLAYKTLASELVTFNYDSQKISKVSKVITILGNVIPLPGIETFAKIVSGVIDHVAQDRFIKTAKLISNLVRNLKVLDDTSQGIARLLAFQYEEQIMSLKDEDAAILLAECAVGRVIEIFSHGLLSDDLPLSEQVCSLLPEYQSRQGFLKLKDQNITCSVSKPRAWTDKGIFQRTGIELEDGQCCSIEGCEAELYGYRLGTRGQIANKASIAKDSRQHPLQDNPFRRKQDVLSVAPVRKSPFANNSVHNAQSMMPATSTLNNTQLAAPEQQDIRPITPSQQPANSSLPMYKASQEVARRQQQEEAQRQQQEEVQRQQQNSALKSAEIKEKSCCIIS